MKTRKQYLNKELTHKEYYTQFVNNTLIQRVINHIGIDAIKKSTCPNFNDIPLHLWDTLGRLPYQSRILIKQAGDNETMSFMVCTYKAAATLIKNKR